jgi:aminoglycoside phosphotransferase (APT) family kinase protein
MDLAERCAALAAELGLGPLSGDVTPLTGGVASDIARIDLPGGPVAMKFALPKLKVAADWFAPVHRNRAEYAWMRAAAGIVPDAVPGLLGASEVLNGFAMDYVAGPDVRLWKADLLAGRDRAGMAGAVADAVGRIHAASTRPGFDRTPFGNADDFHAIRIEPYLLHTAGRHPDLAAALTAMAGALHRADAALVHGDVSPKNILFRGSGPVLLDAECATMGDPSFDVAFCLNHLCLKAVHMPRRRAALIAEARVFWAAYAPHASWEDPAALEVRLAVLLPMLMLARVDGKSPVEYLDPAGRDRVRGLARALIASPAPSLSELLAKLEAA